MPSLCVCAVVCMCVCECDFFLDMCSCFFMNNDVILGLLKSGSLKFYFNLFSLSVISLKKNIKNKETILKGELILKF